MKEKIKSIPILNLDNYKNYYKINPSMPFLVKGYVKKWVAYKKWTFKFFIEQYPDLIVSISSKKNGYKTFNCELEKFIKLIRKGDNEFDFTLHSWLFELNAPELCLDYKPDLVFENWFEDLPFYIKPKVKFIFIGSKNTGTTLHQDPINSSAWNALIKGQKKWYFFPPTQKIAKHYFEYETLIKQDFKKIKPLEIVQNQGDLVYIPPNWFHCVYNTENYISLSENFMNETNYTNVLQYFKSFNQVGYISILEKLIKEKTTYNI